MGSASDPVDFVETGAIMAQARWFLLVLTLIIVGVAFVVGETNCNTGKVSKAEQQAAVLGGERDAAVKEADREAARRFAKEPDLKAAQSRVDSARVKVKKDQASIPLPTVSDNPLVAVVDDQNELIAAQDELNRKKDEKIASLERENEELRRAIDLGLKRERALEIALDAQKRAAKSGKWLGRIQGFAIGVTVGYVGGKLQ